MARIKEILTRKYFIREVVLLAFIVLSLLYLCIHSSFALFQKTIEKVGAVNFEASDIMISLSSDEPDFVINSNKKYGTITVEASQKKSFDITLTNDTPTDVKYKMWYKFSSGVTILDVEVGISNSSLNPETSSLLVGESADVRVVIKNNSEQSATIDIGVQGGYINNEVELAGSHEMSTISENYKDDSGANPPILSEGMIPVTYDYDNDVWVRADTSSEWYNYDEQWWANAVTTTSTNRQKYLSDEHIGKEIPMDEINSMWVWIPRYKYKIASNLGNGTSNPPQIDVVFENGTAATGVTEAAYRAGMSGTENATNTNYYTHPAFRDMNNIEYSDESESRGAWDEEITGFWAAKFETGTSNTTCNSSPSETNCKDVDPIIKPDVKSLRSQNVSIQFLHSLKFAGGTMNTSTGVVTFTTNTNNIYGLNTTSNTTDTHMMKNTEWGAVAYLSQSKYGKNGNTSYTGMNKDVYKNDSSRITGRSSGKYPLYGDSSNGTYSYNDKSCTTVTTTTLGNICTGSKTANAGQGASTTGNIYGVYDMSGGAYEYTMGNFDNYSGFSSTSFSGFSGMLGTGSSTEGISFPENKYYDLYIFSVANDELIDEFIVRSKSIMGDATWETLGWYANINEFVYPNAPWALRGYLYEEGDNVGIFAQDSGSGDGNSYKSFRPVLIP